MKVITADAVKEFANRLIEEEKSNNTVNKYVRDIALFAGWLGGREITKKIVIEYKETLCEKYAPRSTNATIASLNSFFGFMGWQEMRIKTLKIQRQIFSGKSKELTKKEYERLLAAAKQKNNMRLYYLMQTICSTGIRISELQYITVKAVKKGQATINCKGKLRVVIIPKKLCEMLKEYIGEKGIKKGAVFISRNGNPLDRSHIWKMMKALCKVAGVLMDKVFPHNFRHLFARTYYNLQKDIVRLADILGHSSVNTTRIYTIETGEVHRKQIQRLGLLMS